MVDKEQVLVFSAELLNEQHFVSQIVTGQRLLADYQEVLFDSPPLLFFMDRDKAESDPSYKQLIPYCVLYSLSDKRKFFTYRRTKKGGENRLYDKYSIGVGGHVNPVDAQDYLGFSSHYFAGLSRELKEEVGLDINYEPSPWAMIYDDSNDVGKVHFGIVHFIAVAEDRSLSIHDNALATGEWKTKEEIEAISDKLENWSRFILEAGLLT